MISQGSDKKNILFGEKEGQYARDNAYSLFEYMYDSGRRDVYFIAARACYDKAKLSRFGQHVIRYNSLKHLFLLNTAKLLVVNDGFRDVYPKINGILKATDTPFFYLQHGITRYKRVNFTSSHYWGRLLRITAATDFEVDILSNQMLSLPDAKLAKNLDLTRYLLGLKNEASTKVGLAELANTLRNYTNDSEPRLVNEANRQAGIAERMVSRVGFPRSRIIQSGFARHDKLAKSIHDEPSQRVNEIVVFFTWRDYWPSNPGRNKNSPIAELICELLSSPEVINFTNTEKIKFRVLFHHKQKLHAKILSAMIPDSITDYIIIDDTTDISTLLSKCRVLITDYSSVAYEFCLAKTPVIFYQPDWAQYQNSRGDYTKSDSDWIGPRVMNSAELVQELVNLKNVGYVSTTTESLLEAYPSFGNSLPALTDAVDGIPPRVLFVAYNIYGTGGTVRTVTNTANYLHEKGYHVEVISLRRNRHRPDMGLHPAIRVYSLQDHTRQQSKYEKFLARRKSRLFNRKIEQYPLLNLLMDVRLAYKLMTSTTDVMVATFPGVVPICNMFKRKKTKLLVQEHQFYEAHDPDTKELVRKSYAKADGVTVLSDKDAKDNSRFAKKVFKVPNGVVLPDRVWPVKPDRLRIVSLGRLHSWKRFDLLITAFSHLSDKYLDWDLHIFGEGQEFNSLKSQIEELGLTDRVFLEGLTTDSLGEIYKAEIFALPSEYEPFGMVLIEAYAVGRPVVSFDVETGPKEIVVEGKTGFRAAPYSTEDFADKLSTLMSDHALRKELGINAKNAFLEKYNSDAVGKIFERVLKEIVN